MVASRLLTPLSLVTLIAQASIGNAVPSAGDTLAVRAATIQETNLPGSYKYKGCLVDNTTARVLPYQLNFLTTNSPDVCLTQCDKFRYPAAGVEGQQCFCGDITDVTDKHAAFVANSECNEVCPGDPSHICGGKSRLTLYYSNPLDVWNAPMNAGFYKYFMPGLVVPLIATVGKNGKISFLEKKPSQFNNSTGAYELDPSLAPNIHTAWREMHVKSDIFCSASLILPDKGARQINLGGWSKAAAFGVRLYYPDGHLGVNGTHDWQENFNEVALQRNRWYPTAAMLPNGSILVVGGLAGAGGPAQPTLEIVPRPKGGDTTITLPYLASTNPNNLYPFVLVLGSGRIFIGYYNQARVLDSKTFGTVKTLPGMPGLVNDPGAGRNYPYSGAAVLLPQHAPYTSPVEVLICGGSAPDRTAIDNCISMAPEAANPTWTIERMPSGRVMPCMVTLPDGTYMIMNGAKEGLAGFGQAKFPNLNALLYDPSKPVGQRISTLGTTTIARLYHSEATLLPDGRVLVSGSDPQTYNANGTPIFPEEFRIEVYIPPYLNQGLKQPTFTIPNTDWAYGGKYNIVVKLFQGSTGTMRVSLIAASSSTHGNVMSGGRILFPAFSCAGTTCTITAPPNAQVSPPSWYQLFVLDGPTPSHSAWVRVGGDPGKLGNWPPFRLYVAWRLDMLLL